MSFRLIPGGGWWEFEGDEPPGMIFTSPDEGGDHDTVRGLLGLIDDGREPHLPGTSHRLDEIAPYRDEKG